MATKKAVSKKAPVAKKSNNKSKKVKKTEMQSFKLAQPDGPFFTFSITRQTFYWVIITLLVLVVGLWAIERQVAMNSIYDAIEANQAVDDSILPAKSP